MVNWQWISRECQLKMSRFYWTLIGFFLKKGKYKKSVWTLSLIYLSVFILFLVSRLAVFTLSNANHGESIVIGLAASSTSKGPRVKTTEPMVLIKVTNCSIQLGWILARDGFAKNYMGSRPEAKKCDFFISACWCMYVCMDGCYRFFGTRFFPHRCTDWNEIEKIALI